LAPLINKQANNQAIIQMINHSAYQFTNQREQDRKIDSLFPHETIKRDK
jgi:hypothetical protein